MIVVKEAIIVEGKYDKIKLSSFIDGMIIETRGFRIFKDREQMAFIRKMAQARGLLILTDSDSAGFLIRNYLKGSIPSNQIKHAYIPDIFGKEPRKDAPSKEGKLGVEGMQKQLLINALEKAGVVVRGQTAAETNRRQITKQDFFQWGLTGAADSGRKRKQLLKQLQLPAYLTANAMIDAINSFMTYEMFSLLVQQLEQQGESTWSLPQ